MKKLILVLLPTLFFTQQIEDQSVVQGSELLMTRKPNRSTVVDGSPYIFKDYSNASIAGSQRTYKLNYNAFEDEMEFMQDGQNLYVNKVPNQRFTFKDIDKTYVFLQYNLKNEGIKEGYLVELVNNPEKYSLYKLEKIEKISSLEGLNAYQKSKNAYYERKKDTYLISHNNEFVIIPSNFKKLSEPYQSLIDTYKKANKISYNDESLTMFTKAINNN